MSGLIDLATQRVDQVSLPEKSAQRRIIDGLREWVPVIAGPDDRIEEAFRRVDKSTNDSSDVIRDLGAARIYKHIRWYERHSKRMSVWAYGTRILAVMFGLLAVLAIDAATLLPRDAATPNLPYINWKLVDVPFLATGLAVIASFLIFSDRIFLMTRNYTRFRLTAIEMRDVLSDFYREFEKADNNSLDDERRILALKDIADLKLGEIEAIEKAETTAWAADFQQGLETAASRFDQIVARVRADSKTLKQKREELEGKEEELRREGERLAKEKAAQADKAAQRVGLTIKVRKDQRQSDVAVKCSGPLESPDEELLEIENVLPGSQIAFLVLPGLYKVQVLGAGPKIEAFQKVEPGQSTRMEL